MKTRLDNDPNWKQLLSSIAVEIDALILKGRNLSIFRSKISPIVERWNTHNDACNTRRDELDGHWQQVKKHREWQDKEALPPFNDWEWDSHYLYSVSHKDFRDIEGFSSEEAIILSAGSPGLIYKTIDGGKNWQLVYEDNRPEIFFDAMDFWDSKSGIAFSDAIEGHIVIISTKDNGASWQTLPAPEALPGEGGFAASGTCLTTVGDAMVWIALGTPKSRVIYSTNRGKTWDVFNTPMAQDLAGAGIFSLAFSSAEYGIAVGGNYLQPNDSTKVISYTENGGKTWRLIKNSGVNSYKSAIANIRGTENWLCAGPTGVNFSSDNGKNWQIVDTTAYHTIEVLKNRTGWLSGADGKIARIKILNNND